MSGAEVDVQPLNVEVPDGGGPPGGHQEGYGRLIRTSAEQGIDGAEVKGFRVDVLHENEELLVRYLTSRRLSSSTQDSYGTAMGSFDRIVGVPLEEAGAPDVGAWYRGTVARGLAASSVALYASRLGKLMEHAMVERGFTHAEARRRARAAMASLPMADLRREIRRSLKGREILVTPGELEALVGVAAHPRSRALVAVLHESACRKGELLSLRVRDAVPTPTHVELRVLGKTGQRTLPLVTSRAALEAWLDVHPDPRPEAPLFATVVSGKVRRMDDRTPNKLLADLCRRTGLRHVTPHMLRHTRLTELARAGVGEFVLKSFAGWTAGSSMAERYVHLSGRAHVPAILRLQGVPLEEALT